MNKKVKNLGRRIRNLDQLEQAVKNHEAISSLNACGNIFGRTYGSAAFVYNMNTGMVHRWLKFGMYIHKPKLENLKRRQRRIAKQEQENNAIL